MLVLIDESGCSGFKLDKGSTPCFSIALAIFDDYSVAEKTSAAIAALRRKLGVKPEFKFSKCKNEYRDKFFQQIPQYNFRVRSLVVPKQEIYSVNLQTNTKKFYNFFVKLVIQHDDNTLNGARIKIDGSGDRRFKQELNKYLRRQMEPGKIEKLRFANSKNDNLVQLADMCAGAVGRAYRDDRSHPDRWLNMLRPRIEDLWEFGK